MREGLSEKIPAGRRKTSRASKNGGIRRKVRQVLAAGAVGAASVSSPVDIKEVFSGVGDTSGGIRIEFSHKLAKEQLSEKEASLFTKVFHDLDKRELAVSRSEVEMYKAKIYKKDTYEKEHVYIPRKYEQLIRSTAKANGLLDDTLLGVISVESGGEEDITHPVSGARGVGMFMVGTGARYGLVGESFDRRGDPVKSIEAAGKYLRDLKSFFAGDEGIAIWAYHAGEGNVTGAFRVYFKDTQGIDIGDYEAAIENNDAVAREEIETKLKEMISRYKVSLHKLLSNERVKHEVVNKLDDYSGTYAYQALAAAELFANFVSLAERKSG